MKTVVYFCIFLTLPFLAFAQKSFKMKQAEKNYFSFHYAEAIKYYNEILKQTPDNNLVKYRIADSYRRMNIVDSALYFYAQIIDSYDIQESDKLYYAQLLAQNKQYDKAKEWYDKYAETSNDKRAEQFSKAYTNLNTFYRDSAIFNVKKVSFNSKTSDFSPMFFKQGVVFVSARKKQYIIKHTFHWDNSAYLNLFYFKNDTLTSFSGELNTIYHEGPCTFNSAGDTIYFTRNNYKNILNSKKSANGSKLLKIFTAKQKNGSWQDVEEFIYNSNDYSCGHPALSVDNKKLYFVSDMPGGFGGTDLYVCELESGKWSTPKNLGENINTQGNEMFPFIDSENNLYFASDGHAGLGGLDVFVSENHNTEFADVKNLGYPINTHRDDFGFIFDPINKTGYLSSNRNGNDDIFSFEKKQKQVVIYTYNAHTGDFIVSSKIQITQNDESLPAFYTKIDKSDKMIVLPEMNYQFSAIKDEYEPASLSMTYAELKEIDTLKISLLPVTYKLEVFTYKEMDKKALEGTKVSLYYKENEVFVEEATVDWHGKHTFMLEKNREYKIVAHNPDLDCNTLIDFQTTVGLSSSTTLYSNLGFFCVGDIIEVKNIYYDLDKSNIKESAAKELDKLLEIMNRYPTMKIELRSHTDSRGSDSYNLQLSDRRARSAADYVISKGVPKKRIVGKGYGETELLNRCKNGVKCDETEHQANRRTEFKVLSLK